MSQARLKRLENHILILALFPVMSCLCVHSMSSNSCSHMHLCADAHAETHAATDIASRSVISGAAQTL